MDIVQAVRTYVRGHPQGVAAGIDALADAAGVDRSCVKHLVYGETNNPLLRNVVKLQRWAKANRKREAA